jgi:hypothetical protein
MSNDSSNISTISPESLISSKSSSATPAAPNIELTSPTAMGSKQSSIPSKEFYFMNLPGDLRYEIYSYFFPRGTINITLPKRKNGVVPHCFKHFFRVEGLQLLILSKQIFAECSDFLWTRNKFTSKDALTFNALPGVMGGAVANIKHIELKNHFRMVVDSQQQWPKMMRLLSENFTSLSTFELYADFGAMQGPLEEKSGTDRVRQEVRASVRFGAFLVVRIPQLSFLVLELPYAMYGRAYARVKVTEHAPKVRDGEILLNSRAIRHAATWNELHDVSIKHFEIDSNCPTSEMASFGLLPKDMKKIDTIGYQTRGELYRKNIHQTPSVDTMIIAARENMMAHERMAQEARARKKNTETTLGKIVEMFPKGLSLPIEDQMKGTRKMQNGRGSMSQGRLDRNPQANAPNNTRRMIPTDNQTISPARGGRGNWRGVRGRGGRGGAPGAHAVGNGWEQMGFGALLDNNQQAPHTPANLGGAQGPALGEDGDWPALGSVGPSRRRR